MTELIDRYHRRITYVRMSVTDRCDFRCQYCMAEDMTFLPREQVLSLEELAQVAAVFRSLGVSKLRITGGEPLIRKGVLTLFKALGAMGFEDLSLTTNGSHLPQYARALTDAGVHRVNISLDSLRPARFKQITRTGKLSTVLHGVEAAREAGFQRIKINCVAMKNVNADELLNLTEFALNKELDISFIEEMPLGVISSHQREEEHLASAKIRALLATRFNLQTSSTVSGGPSKYWSVPGYASRIGFISPHSENFCATCNRVRVSAEGRLLLCLGNEHSIDLRHILRSYPQEETHHQLRQAIIKAMEIKPEKHHFNLHEPPQILRFMNATGG